MTFGITRVKKHVIYGITFGIAEKRLMKPTLKNALYKRDI